MKYGKKIIRDAVKEFPCDKIEGEETRKELLVSIKSITPTKEGIFGCIGKWKIKIHFILGYIKINYFPEYPSKKHRIYYRRMKDE